MSIIAPGTPAPELTLKTEDGEDFTRADLVGQTTILVFYPFAFSPVCTDQLQVYQGVLGEIEAKGARIFGVSTDPFFSQKAFKEKLGIAIQQLSDFEPKGATAKAFGAYFEPGGMTNRALVVTDADGVVRWSHLADSPGDLPPAELLFEGLAAVERAS
ncbi:MAG TPA: redoxin domain-containing protein [Solirubrobacteraceae bacterium]|jgi:peroxiredoxin (alkyl hydroperoxide reductase subunit C)|nr:redoxin domain-containing protein [Solirubrobacteraceae bacterium]